MPRRNNKVRKRNQLRPRAKTRRSDRALPPAVKRKPRKR